MNLNKKKGGLFLANPFYFLAMNVIFEFATISSRLSETETIKSIVSYLRKGKKIRAEKI